MSSHHVDLITAVAPHSSEHLSETIESVQVASWVAEQMGWTLNWLVAIDGPGEVSVPAGDFVRVQRLPVARGASVARNYALTQATAEGWVLSLDADDVLDAKGLAALLSDEILEDVGWAAGNREFFDGERVVHWLDEPQPWSPGELAVAWASPLLFNPSTILVRSSLARAVGGWPALPASETLGYALAVSEESSGVSTTHVVTHYRSQDEQASAKPWYQEAKEAAFRIIEETLNARRALTEREAVHAPSPGMTGGAVPLGQGSL
jgi:glycosyltransferase involved in cell wall biosynthesis